MKSSKGGNDKNRGLSDHMITLHQRLQHSLRLGIKYSDDRQRKWQCTDAEIQGRALRTMSAFISCISSDISQLPLVKDSITDMLVALEGILQSGNEAVLSSGTNVTAKLLDLLGNSIPQYSVAKLIRPLSFLLSSQQFPIAISCAIALNRILSKLRTPWRIERHKEVWEAVKETNAVGSIICALQVCINGIQQIGHFSEFASVLKTILWWWSPSRYSVWSDNNFIAGLGNMCLNNDPSVATAALQLYSALALCGNGAMKLLENEEILALVMMRFMGSTQPRHIRMDVLILVQYLARSEEGCSKMIGLCGEPIVEGITNAMNGWATHSAEKVPTDQIPLVVEACRSALITRWPGLHHSYFWRVGVAKSLLGLLLNNFSEKDLSLEEQILTAHAGLYTTGFPSIRPYIWDILGWLATHCREDFNPKNHSDGGYLTVLIACACSVAVDSIHKGAHFSHKGFPSACECEPAARAVLLMVFSHCKFIASKSRHYLSELVMPNSERYLKCLLESLKSAASRNDLAESNSLQVVNNLIGLLCHLSLLQCQNLTVQTEVTETLSAFIRKRLSNEVQVRRENMVSHLLHSANEITCCWVHTEDWEGGDVILFLSVWALSELIRHSDFACAGQEKASGQIGVDVDPENSEAQVLVNMLQEIRDGSFSPGLRWYAQCSLSFFGCYGFPSKFGERIKKSLNERELADLQIILQNGQSLGVHGIILLVKCPSLLPPEELHPDENKILDASTVEKDVEQLCRRLRREVRLSARIDSNALIKLLEFVYAGFIVADDDFRTQLKVLAKRCKLHTLTRLLERRRPQWGTAIPNSDLTPALGLSGRLFSDIILEGKATAEETLWSCSSCSLAIPHMHVHKIILWFSSDYFQALFQSGMQDSRSQTINVPVCWGALAKLASWFYSGKLPKPTTGCLWDNMDTEKKLYELQTYIELCWLSDFWFLEEVQEESLRVVLSCLKSCKQLTLKIIQIAANFTQWKIVEVAARDIAPLYPKIRDSGDLEVLDEELQDMVRVIYVRFSQERHCYRD